MALTLTRKVGELVRIGDSTVEIASVRGGSIKLRIVAPSDVRIVRCELESQTEDQDSAKTKGQ